MCNCPLTSLNKVLISVFSHGLWLNDPSITDARLVREGCQWGRGRTVNFFKEFFQRVNHVIILILIIFTQMLWNLNYNWKHWVQVEKTKCPVASKCFRTTCLDRMSFLGLFVCLFFALMASHRALSWALRLFALCLLSLGQVFFPSSYVAFTFC